MGPAGEKFHLYVLLTVPYAVYFVRLCPRSHELHLFPSNTRSKTATHSQFRPYSIYLHHSAWSVSQLVDIHRLLRIRPELSLSPRKRGTSWS